MRTTLILNQDGGTIRGMDAREFGDMAAAKLSGNGGEATVRLVSGSELVDALKDAAADEDTDTIVIRRPRSRRWPQPGSSRST